MSDEGDRMVVFSDYVCPFCYLGKVSLERYRERAEDPPEVEWRPFDLQWSKRRPDGSIDPSVEDGKNEAYYERAKANVRRLAEDYDVEMSLELATDVDSWNAHKASLYVEREHPDDWRDFHEGVFEALWIDGRDVGDPDVLDEVAESVGLPADAVREAVESSQLDEDLREAFEASHKQGVTGVPTFAYRQLRLPGAVPPEDIDTLVENARE